MKPWSSLNSRLAISRRSSSIATDRRAAQGPWLTRDVINKHPVFVVDYKDLERPGSSTKRNDKSKANETVERGLLKDFRQVASFNWYGSAAKPVLIIPGSPRYFRSSWAGGVVKADVEERIISPHLYMTPDYPMESLFLSVKVSWVCNLGIIGLELSIQRCLSLIRQGSYQLGGCHQLTPFLFPEMRRIRKFGSAELR